MKYKSLIMTIAIMSIAMSSEAQVTFTDSRDGENYKSVKIGTQIWMTENLRTTKFNDGTSIPLVTDKSEWSNLTTPGYCWYNNDTAANKITYGALYNWYTVSSGKLCPTGWHVPADAEWKILEDYLGTNVVGGKLKEIGTTHWNSPNEGATNEYNFSALPSGYRAFSGNFGDLGGHGHWWSSTEYGTNGAWHRSIDYNFSYALRYTNNKKAGFSVRCLRD